MGVLVANIEMMVNAFVAAVVGDIIGALVETGE